MCRTTACLAVAMILSLVLVGCGGGDAATGTVSSPGASSAASSSATPSAATGSAGATLSASRAFLATLSADQKNGVVADRTPANLSQWSNLPDPRFKRAGLRMDSLSDAQQKAVLAILQAALSPEGYQQVTQITTANGVLASSSPGGDGPDFGADHYWIRFVGEPSATDAYTIQYGGHHLALNVTSKGSSMTIAPTLWGPQPPAYEEAGAKVEPPSDETTKAFAVIGSLTPAQQQEAILATPVDEIVLGAGQDGKTLSPEGAKASTFTAEQKAKLIDLVTEWLTTLNTEYSTPKVTQATADLDQMTFAWSGETTIGNPIYYRVQSPTFIIESALQQGQRGPRADGIHSIYREIGNDYAGDTGS